jgi:SAM-dependent methyltransferase
MTAETRYDAVEYPAGLYPTTHPGHLAAIARLHGLSAPEPMTARVLEIAGGDGVNLISMAASLPDAHFTSFDLSSRAVARGAGLVRGAGLANVVIETRDLLDAADQLEGSFDYVIAHGLYAWVPAPVRDAALRLIGRVLSPKGIAFISYNALPGGHLRTAIREMLLHGLSGFDEPAERVARAREILVGFATPQPGDRPLLAAMREVAEPIARKNSGSLFHDELSDCFAPQALSEVTAAAQAYGLAFLNDAVPTMVLDGMPGTDMDDAATVAQAQASDYEAFAFFHQTLFVREGRAPRRRLDPAALADVYATTQVKRTGQTTFERDDYSFEVEDFALADFLDELRVKAPERLALAPFAASASHADAILELYRVEAVQLHATPFPGTLRPGERPRASAVALAQVRLGLTNLYTLDQRIVAFSEPGPRLFLSLLDGTRDRAAIASEWAGSAFGDQISADDALAQLARAGLIVA